MHDENLSPDIDLYGSRVHYYFWPEGTPISPHLPPKDTLEEQVAAANLWEFFRLVRFHGGKEPYFEWHDNSRLPIVVMSPTVKLTEGAVGVNSLRGYLSIIFLGKIVRS